MHEWSPEWLITPIPVPTAAPVPEPLAVPTAATAGGAGTIPDDDPRRWRHAVLAWPDSLRDARDELVDHLDDAGLGTKLAEAVAYLVVRSTFCPTDGPIHPASPKHAWRSVVADWPDDRREAWGRRANELSLTGVLWPNDEIRAFEELSVDS
jgi:hypothetical protein